MWPMRILNGPSELGGSKILYRIRLRSVDKMDERIYGYLKKYME